MEYNVIQLDGHNYYYELTRPTKFKELVQEISDCMSTCNIHIPDTGDLYNFKFGEIEHKTIPEMIMNMEIENVWYEVKTDSTNHKSYWYIVSLHDYAGDKNLTDEDVKRISLDYLKVRPRFLKMLTDKIFPDKLGKVTDIESGIKCNMKGPFITYRYVKFASTKQMDVIDEGFRDFYLDNLNKE